MTIPKPVVFLMDVDNTLLDNDKIAADVKRFLDREVGRESQERFFATLEDIREQIGYSDYLASLQRLARLQPRRALPAHGPPIEDPLALIHHYVEHRRRREEQVLAALERGPRSIGAITSAIYTELTPALMPMARESVLAHLGKLEHDGRARRDGEQWMLSP